MDGIEIDLIYSNDFPIHRSIDLSGYRRRMPVPRDALTRCSRMILSLFLGRDIRICLDRGVHTSGITESLPFFSSLIWNALVYVGDWETERSNINIMLDYPMDCNYIGLCGFSLLHFYLLQALVSENGFEKLVWWANHTFVRINTPIIIKKKDASIYGTMLHPIEWISGICQEKKNTIMDERMIRIFNYIISRGASIHFLPASWILPNRFQAMAEGGFLSYRIKSIYGEWWRWKWQTESIKVIDMMRIVRILEMGESDHVLNMPSVSMNVIPEIDPSHHLIFVSLTCATSFRFHAGYLESITKTHTFPFTGEKISREIIRSWLEQVREAPLPWLMEDIPITDLFGSHDYCTDHNGYEDRGLLILQVLYEWITIFYPYTRIMNLVSMTWNREKLMTYLCHEINKDSYFIFNAFHIKNKKEEETFESFFLRSAMDCMRDGFLFSNRLEDLISRIQMFASIQEKIGPIIFHDQFPRLREFVESPQYIGLVPIMKFYQEEHDVTILHIFYMLRDLSQVLSS